MSQNTTVVLDGTGVQVLSRINAALDTINTLHAGATAPPDAECHVNMLWADTANGLLKLCTVVGAPSTFITLGKLAANLGLLRTDGSNPMAGALDFASASPASATTLAVAGGNLLKPTGVTTIAGLAEAQDGAHRTIRFTTALQLTNSATFILFGKNIITESGDSATFISLGAGTWFLHSYQRGDGSIDMGTQFNEAMGANIAAAATTDLAAMSGNYAIVTNTTGATAISALGNGAPGGARRAVTFSITGGSVSLTHNATSLILPGANNISVTDGDSAIFMSLGNNNWRMLMLQRNSLAARIWNIVTKNSSYTVTTADYGNYLVSIASAANTFTLPSAASAGSAFVVGARNSNSNSAMLTIAANGSDTVEGVSSMNVGVGSSYVLICDGVSSWVRMDTGISPTSPQAFTNGSQVFTGSGTFTVPAGVYYLRVTQWGGGSGGAGGGGKSNAANIATGGGGGSGAAGAFATGIFAVIPSQNYTVTIGLGGAGGAGGASGGGNGAAGGAGGTTSFGALLTCTGGTAPTGGIGCTTVNGAAGTSGSGGTASGSGTLINGGAGGASAAGTDNASGASGGSGVAGGVSGGAQAGTAAVNSTAGLGVTGSGGAAKGASTTGTTRESGGSVDGAQGKTGAGTGNAGAAGGSPGAGGAGGSGGYNATTAFAYAGGAGGNGGDGKCIVEW